jgi:pSer/pThr/pTyr-binding forkhead associated (FHA) protein
MNPLKSLETTIANLVEGGFGRLFRTEVRPIELARKLAREMDEHRTASVSRVYAPNEYSVWLSPEDRVRYEGVEHEVIDELCAYLLEHARREDLILASPPLIVFHTDEDLSLGEFGIQARLVRAPEQHGGQPRSAVDALSPPDLSARDDDEHGQTMIYSTSARTRRAGGGLIQEAAAPRATRALLVVGGRRLIVPPRGATIGRSRDCDIVLDDSGASRRHAEISPQAEGWELRDLNSTNGVRVNGRAVNGLQTLRQGDRVEIGSTEIVFELG